MSVLKLGKYTLKSGLESPIYLDLRRLVAARVGGVRLIDNTPWQPT